jgi:tRNA 2-thiouridine synthesizing protein D
VSILLIVNASPWGSTVSNTALRFARAALAAGQDLPAVFFQGDGVYGALPGRATDSGAQDLWAAWNDMAQRYGTDLMLCSGSVARRLPGEPGLLAPGWREAGLVEMFELSGSVDKVVSF